MNRIYLPCAGIVALLLTANTVSGQEGESLQVLTPTPIEGKALPELLITCQPTDTSVHVRLFNDFGGIVMDKDLRLRQRAEGRCLTDQLGSLIEPPLEKQCTPGTICIHPPTYEGLVEGNYIAELTITRSGGESHEGRYEFSIAPFEQTIFSEGAPNWKVVRGTWDDGPLGLSATGDGGLKPQYYQEASKNFDYSIYRDSESTFSLGCFTSECLAGHTVGFQFAGATAGIERYSGIQVGVGGDGMLWVRTATETPTGIAVVPIAGPIDVSATIAESPEINLRTDAVSGIFTDTGRVAVYLNDGLVGCFNFRNYSGGGPATLFFQAANDSESVDFHSYRHTEGIRQTIVCSYVTN